MGLRLGFVRPAVLVVTRLYRILECLAHLPMGQSFSTLPILIVPKRSASPDKSNRSWRTRHVERAYVTGLRYGRRNFLFRYRWPPFSFFGARAFFPCRLLGVFRLIARQKHPVLALS